VPSRRRAAGLGTGSHLQVRWSASRVKLIHYGDRIPLARKERTARESLPTTLSRRDMDRPGTLKAPTRRRARNAGILGEVRRGDAGARARYDRKLWIVEAVTPAAYLRA
jgi:hypothetical protein